MKKVLFTATVDNHILSFHLPFLEFFKKNGYEVHVASNGQSKIPYVDKKFNIPFERSPFNMNNLKSFKLLKELILYNDYNIIHCHTPVGASITRISSKKARKTGTKVIYTAHGFHFYKGAPLLNWLLYYTTEKLLAHYTDCLITINEEDYKRAKKRNFKSSSIEYVHGVGVDTNLFYPIDHSKKNKLRELHGFSYDDFLIFNAAEFNKNKNQELLIKALHKLKKQIPSARLLLAGEGPFIDHCKDLTKNLGLEDTVKFLGFRRDVSTILSMCNVVVSASRREGLPVNILEAMATGLPLVVRSNRGHNELVKDGLNGYIIKQDDPNLFAEKILILFENEKIRSEMGSENFKKVKKYSRSEVENEMEIIYKRYM